MSEDLQRRVEALEAETKALREQVDAAMGEAMIASFLISPIFKILALEGVVKSKQVTMIYDNLLLVLERNRASAHPSTPAAAIDHARSRIEKILATWTES